MNYDGGYGVEDAQLLDKSVEETTDSAAIIKQRNQTVVSSVLLFKPYPIICRVCQL